ncbi:MAG: DUF2933 domain-containing protein [Bacillota bacterium]
MKQKKGHGRWMLVACLVPVAILAYMFLVKDGKSINLGGFNSVYLILLLCPLMHLFMMRGMHGHGGKGADCHGKDDAPGNKTDVGRSDH